MQCGCQCLCCDFYYDGFMAIPERLERIIQNYNSVPKPIRLQLLLESGKKVPALPEKWQDAHDEMEQVHECQTPFFLATEHADDGSVSFFFDAPSEAPTILGFAGILSEGLNGLAADEILAVPDDFYLHLGLAEVISPLRMRGIAALLRRLKGQVSAYTEA